MYIWILLATFMVMLSFFNTSPREDKVNVFSEIKASSYINRFRAEHLAYFRTWDCEVMYNSGTMFGSGSTSPVFELGEENADFGYTSLQDNLPIGYDTENGAYQIYHDIYCFSGDLLHGSPTPALQDCRNSQYRYLISYAQIPERWLSKTKTQFTMELDGSSHTAEINAPLPAFTTYLAKDLNGMKNTGWMWCDFPNTQYNCHLAGRSAIQTLYDKTETTVEAKSKYINFVFPRTMLTDRPAERFQNACSASGIPCLFSFQRFRTTDTGGHCAGLMDAYRKEQQAQGN